MFLGNVLTAFDANLLKGNSIFKSRSMKFTTLFVGKQLAAIVFRLVEIVFEISLRKIIQI